jgi:hypothetical protein
LKALYLITLKKGPFIIWNEIERAIEAAHAKSAFSDGMMGHEQMENVRVVSGAEKPFP